MHLGFFIFLLLSLLISKEVNSIPPVSIIHRFSSATYPYHIINIHFRVPTPLIVMMSENVEGGTTENRSVAPSNALEFFRLVGRLKVTKRTGWINNSISLPESIADHMYRMSMLAMTIVDPTIDKNRLIKMCLVHDLGEAIVGDIVPHDTRVPPAEKRRLEQEAMSKITADLDHPRYIHVIINDLT